MGRKTYLVHARICDGVRDTAIEDGILVFQSGMDEGPGGKVVKILHVGEMKDYPDFPAKVDPADTVVDLTGYTLTPACTTCTPTWACPCPISPIALTRWASLTAAW